MATGPAVLASQWRRPVGLPPRETTSRVNRDVLAEHVDDAAAGWRRRTHFVEAPHVRLHHLARADNRLFAHLAGVHAAGEAGWQAARESLDSGDAGNVFVLTWIAFIDGMLDRMRDTLPVLLAEPGHTDAGVGALASIAPARLHESLQRLAGSPHPAHRRLALAVYALQRRAPGALLPRSLADADPLLRARALRAIGELGRQDLVGPLIEALRDADAGCRASAAGSLLVLGGPGEVPLAVETVQADLSALPEARRRWLLECCIRASASPAARAQVREFAGDAKTLREAIIAAGAHGDPVAVPWLIERMSAPLLGRAAAEAVALITGADLESSALKAAGPGESAPGAVETGDDESADDSIAEREDGNLPHPDPDGFRAWWQANAGRFRAGIRYIAGQPAESLSGCLGVLREGAQRQRRAAAFELARLRPGTPLFAVEAFSLRQRRELGQ